MFVFFGLFLFCTYSLLFTLSDPLVSHRGARRSHLSTARPTRVSVAACGYPRIQRARERERNPKILCSFLVVFFIYLSLLYLCRCFFSRHREICVRETARLHPLAMPAELGDDGLDVALEARLGASGCCRIYYNITLCNITYCDIIQHNIVQYTIIYHTIS